MGMGTHAISLSCLLEKCRDELTDKLVKIDNLGESTSFPDAHGLGSVLARVSSRNKSYFDA